MVNSLKCSKGLRRLRRSSLHTATSPSAECNCVFSNSLQTWAGAFRFVVDFGILFKLMNWTGRADDQIISCCIPACAVAEKAWSQLPIQFRPRFVWETGGAVPEESLVEWRFSRIDPILPVEVAQK